jgi:hypothetical protein
VADASETIADTTTNLRMVLNISALSPADTPVLRRYA